jgi:hypothetical protein
VGSLKEKLLASAKQQSKMVEVDGTEYLVREVSAGDFAEYGAMTKTDRNKATALLVSRCVLDEDGAPLLTSEEAEEVVKSARLSIPIVNAIMELSGFSEKESDAS